MKTLPILLTIALSTTLPAALTAAYAETRLVRMDGVLTPKVIQAKSSDKALIEAAEIMRIKPYTAPVTSTSSVTGADKALIEAAEIMRIKPYTAPVTEHNEIMVEVIYYDSIY